MRRISILLSKESISTLQDLAMAAHRPPKAHLEWLIEQTLQTPKTSEDDLRARVERLEQHLGHNAVS